MNKKMKKSILVFCIVSIILSYILTGCRKAEQAGNTISLSFGEYAVNIFAHENGNYCFFVPYGADLADAVFSVGRGEEVSVSGNRIRNSDKNTVVLSDGEYDITVGENKSTLYVLSMLAIPALFINTQSGGLDYVHENKNNKESGSITVAENGDVTLNVSLDYIKGRGNTTWEFDKKSYNIKLSEKKSLFGMEASKKWCLLANAADHSFLRNRIALQLAENIGIKYVCGSQPVDLYINGNYEGLYLLTEKVETGNGRVEITDLDKLNEEANPGLDIDSAKKMSFGEGCGSKKWTNIPASPADITGGYLLEYDWKDFYAEETAGFCTPNGQYVTVKSPENINKAEVNYISAYVSDAEEAIMSESGYNAKGKHYSEYYDIDSLARMFILQEYLLNFDSGASSCFFAKEENGGKLTAVSAWDFDSSAGNYYEKSIADVFTVDTRCLPLLTMNQETLFPTVYALAFRHGDFREAVRKQWAEIKDDFEKITQSIEPEARYVAASAVCDYFRRNRIIISTPEERESVYLEKYIGELEEFYSNRFVYEQREFTEEPALLFYDCGGVYGYIFSEKMTFIGDSVTVKGTEDGIFGTTVSGDGKLFVGWNTERDGSGDCYLPDDTMTLHDTTTTLYAQWKAIE